MPTYARREGSAYARGELWVRRSPVYSPSAPRVAAAAAPRGRRPPLSPGRRIALHRNFQAHRAVQDARAEQAREGGVLLRRLELHQAGDGRRTAVVHEAEGVYGAERLAQREDRLGDPQKSRASPSFSTTSGFMTEPILGLACACDYPKKRDTAVVGVLQTENVPSTCSTRPLPDRRAGLDAYWCVPKPAKQREQLLETEPRRRRAARATFRAGRRRSAAASARRRPAPSSRSPACRSSGRPGRRGDAAR